LAPQPAARFEALSEFRQALQEPLAHPPIPARVNLRAQPWRLALLGALVIQLGFGLWLSLLG
jgi:hypothetical protein